MMELAQLFNITVDQLTGEELPPIIPVEFIPQISEGHYRLFKDTNNAISIDLDSNKGNTKRISIREVERRLLREVSSMSEDEVQKVIDVVRELKGSGRASD